MNASLFPKQVRRPRRRVLIPFSRGRAYERVHFLMA